MIDTNVTNTGRPLGPRVLSASTLNGNDVYNPRGEKLGSIKELMLDIDNGKVCYAVLSSAVSLVSAKSCLQCRGAP